MKINTSIGSFNYCKMKDLKCLAQYSSNITDVRDCSNCELSCANTVYEIEKLSKTYVSELEFLTFFLYE